jgi:hypothetical protein
MNVRHGLAVLALAGSLLIAGAAPALAGGPPVPAGCSFGHGVLTCVTSTTTTSTVGPFTTDGQIGATEMFGSLTGEEICEGFFGLPDAVAVEFTELSFTESVATTTTTRRHGLGGPVFATETTSDATFVARTGGGLNCFF